MKENLLCSLDNGWHYKSQLSTSKSCCIAHHTDYWLNCTKQPGTSSGLLWNSVKPAGFLATLLPQLPHFLCWRVICKTLKRLWPESSSYKRLKEMTSWNPEQRSVTRTRSCGHVVMIPRSDDSAQSNASFRARLSGAIPQIAINQDKGDLTVFG